MVCFKQKQIGVQALRCTGDLHANFFRSIVRRIRSYCSNEPISMPLPWIPGGVLDRFYWC
jgi:hypothetical protein